MKLGILNQRHPEYMGDVWEELDDLYVGGYQLLANAGRYLPQMVGESEARYRDRIKVAAYICYLGQIVDFFVANLFTHEVKIAPAADASDPTTPGGKPDDEAFYSEFAHDADRKGTTTVKLMREALQNSLLKGSALIGLDMPARGDVLPVNRAEEDSLGLNRVYAFPVPLENLIDWELDDESGRFAFAIIHREIVRRESVAESRGARTLEWKVWEQDDDGVVGWSLYRKRYNPDDEMKPDDDIPLVDHGVTSFDRVPLLRLQLPNGLWVGNKIGPLAKEHFQRRNILTAAENKSLFAIPYAKLGSEIGAPGMSIPSEAQQDPNRGDDPRVALANRGYMVLGSGDEIAFAEPSGNCYSVIESQLRDMKDEMFRVVHQMAASVSNIGASLGRSGDSKQEDRQATAVVLGALGAAVRDFLKRIYTVVSRARKETKVVWVPTGLDAYDGDSRQIVLEESLVLDMIPIASKTFKKTLKNRAALQLLPNIEPETADTIKKEIEASVDKEFARAEQLANAPPAQPAQPSPTEVQMPQAPKLPKLGKLVPASA